MNRKRRKWMALVLALVSGGTAGYLAMNYLREPVQTAVRSQPSATQVAVAAHDMPLGSVLSSADIKMVDWPSNNVPPGYARDAQNIVGHGLIQAVSMNEPLLSTKLASKESGGGLPIVIPEGMRAVSVKVDEVIGVAGFVLPSTRVDVLVTLNPSAEREAATTRVILQNVQTLAAGQTIQRDEEGTPQTVTVITLLVTPEQSEKLTLASTEGRIHLALRNMLDMEEVETDGIRAGTLVRTARPVVRRSSGPRRAGQRIVTYNGTTRTETTF